MNPSAGCKSGPTTAWRGVYTKVATGPSNLNFRFLCHSWLCFISICADLNSYCSPEIGFGFQASHTNGAAAFLVPCGASRRVETFLKNKMIPSYLSRRYKDIQARFGLDYDTRTVYIIEGTTHATSWVRGLARRHGREVRGFVSVSPTAGMPGFRVGGSTGEVIDHPVSVVKCYWHTACDVAPVDYRIGSRDATVGRSVVPDLRQSGCKTFQTTQISQT